MKNLETRMRRYEEIETGRKFIPFLPIYVRLDGRSFSRFCLDMEKPFSEKMHRVMAKVTGHLVERTQACIGYTQSDEINLVLNSRDHEDFLGQKIFKYVSIIASGTSSLFLMAYLDEFGVRNTFSEFPSFDCRVINLPNKTEVANMILWRNMDATRCALNSAAQLVYTQKELHGKNKEELHEMLHTKGINFNNYPEHFKRGLFFQKKEKEKLIPDFIWKNIPDSKKPESRVVTRKSVIQLEMPPFVKVTNREEVIFEGANPITES